MAYAYVTWLALVLTFDVASKSNWALGGGLSPKINSGTWQGFEPDPQFARQFNTWPTRRTPEEVQVWCKGFIPGNATSEVIKGRPVMPIKGPFGPIPGLVGQCALIDGRGWDSTLPVYTRPTDSRFWGRLSVAIGPGLQVTADANCGVSENMCCQNFGCWDGSNFGQISCHNHCPDSEMTVERLSCWTDNMTHNGQTWPLQGEPCENGAQDSPLAVNVYIKGRGGNPCATVAGVTSPAASWDVALAVFPTKRKVTILGYVDDAPSYECYAKAKDHGIWGPSVTLAQIPMDLSSNVAMELLGYSDRPVNPDNIFFDLPTLQLQVLF